MKEKRYLVKSLKHTDIECGINCSMRAMLNKTIKCIPYGNIQELVLELTNVGYPRYIDGKQVSGFLWHTDDLELVDFSPYLFED